MSYVAVTMKNQRKQKEAAAVFEQMGAAVGSEPTWLGRLLRDDSLVTVTYVGLSNTDVTDTELAHLQELRQLQALWLANTKVTDVGLAHLQELSELATLGLGNTRVTDAGLVYLQRLRQLKNLDLVGTKVTDEGVRRLRQALPDCNINR